MQASAPMLAGLRVGRPKTCGRSDGCRRSTWDTKPTESLITPLPLFPLPPNITSPNSWKTSSASRLQTAPVTASRWAECGVGVLRSLSEVRANTGFVYQLFILFFFFLKVEVSLELRFLLAFFLQPQWLHHRFMRAESLARAEWKKTPPKASSQFAFHKMTGPTTLTGSCYPTEDIESKKTGMALLAQPVREDTGRNVWIKVRTV